MSQHLTAWLPTIVAGALLAILTYYLRSLVQDMKKESKEKETDAGNRMAKIESDYLKEHDHKLMCENISLKTQKCFTDELTRMKDEIFTKLRLFETMLREHLIRDGDPPKDKPDKPG